MNPVEEHISTRDLVVPANGGTAQVREDEGAGPLLPSDFTGELRSHWDQVQAGFVDEPRKAVQEADELVARAIKRLAESFADARSGLERQWDKGDDVSTEDLRQALRKYRSFFERLLKV